MGHLTAALQLVALGWYIAFSLLVPFGIGLWLDREKFNSFPLCTILGITIGTLSMVIGVYRMVRQVQRAEEQQNLSVERENERKS